MDDGRVSSSSSSSTEMASSSFGYFSVFHNCPLISALVAFAIAQLIKFFTTWCFIRAAQPESLPAGAKFFLQQALVVLAYICLGFLHELEWLGIFYLFLGIDRYKEKRWDAKQLIGSGGMPSSHSATVTALAVAVGFQDGFGGSVFATATIFACVVMYDAFGVRLHAGRQAEVLNQIVYELPVEHPLADTRPLRELLGHTPLQVVAGAILGLVTATIAHVLD